MLGQTSKKSWETEGSDSLNEAGLVIATSINFTLSMATGSQCQTPALWSFSVRTSSWQTTMWNYAPTQMTCLWNMRISPSLCIDFPCTKAYHNKMQTIKRKIRHEILFKYNPFWGVGAFGNTLSLSTNICIYIYIEPSFYKSTTWFHIQHIRIRPGPPTLSRDTLQPIGTSHVALQLWQVTTVPSCKWGSSGGQQSTSQHPGVSWAKCVQLLFILANVHAYISGISAYLSWIKQLLRNLALTGHAATF